MESRALFIHARRVLYHQAISPGTPSHFNIKAAEPEKKKESHEFALRQF